MSHWNHLNNLISRVVIFFFILYQTQAEINDFQTSLKLKSVDGKQNHSKIWGMKIMTPWDKKWGDQFHFESLWGVILEVGSEDALLVSENAPNNELLLDYAFFEYLHQSKLFSMKVGAINQSLNASPLLFSNLPFMASEQKAYFPLSLHSQLYFFAEEAIPTNHSLLSRLELNEKGAPLFFYYGTGVLVDTAKFKGFIEIGNYLFKNLSHNVANISGLQGNSVDGSASELRTFHFSYSGFNIASKITYQQYHLKYIFLNLEFLRNLKAPRGRSDGLRIKIGRETQEMQLALEYFKNESDSSIAFYNTSLRGHNNMEGIGLSSKFFLTKEMDLECLFFVKKPIIKEIIRERSSEIQFNLNIY